MRNVSSSNTAIKHVSTSSKGVFNENSINKHTNAITTTHVRPWILVELRHGAYLRFNLPDSMKNFSILNKSNRKNIENNNNNNKKKNQRDNENTITNLFLGDRVLCRVGGIYQTGIIHGSSLLGKRFFLPFSFTHDSVSASPEMLVSAHSFPRTGGEILGLVVVAADEKTQPAEEKQETITTTKRSFFDNERTRITSFASAKADSDSSSSSSPSSSSSSSSFPVSAAVRKSPSLFLETSSLDCSHHLQAEQDLLRICQEELVQFEIRSLRLVSLVADFTFTVLTLFYVESDSSTPLSSYKQHLVKKLTRFLKLKKPVKVWMTNCYTENPLAASSSLSNNTNHSSNHQNTSGKDTKWPNHLAWPAPSRHQLLALSSSSSSSYSSSSSSVSFDKASIVLAHLIRLIVHRPQTFLQPSSQMWQIALQCYSSSSSSSLSSPSSSSASLSGQVALCCIVSGRWQLALELLLQKNVLPPPREAVAIRLAARRFVPQSQHIAVKNLLDSQSDFKLTRQFLLDELLIKNSEYTSMDQKRQISSPHPSLQISASSYHSTTSPSFSVSHHHHHTVAAVSSYQNVASDLGLWKATDPRSDFNSLTKKMLLLSSSSSSSSNSASSPLSVYDGSDLETRRALVKAINAPYVVKFIPPPNLLLNKKKNKKVKEEDDGEQEQEIDEREDDQKAMDAASFVHRKVCECALISAADSLSYSQQQKQKGQHFEEEEEEEERKEENEEEGEYTSSKIRRMFLTNFHAEFSLRAMESWVKLCRSDGNWEQAIRVLLSASRNNTCRSEYHQEEEEQSSSLEETESEEEQERDRYALLQCADETLKESTASNNLAVQKMRSVLKKLMMTMSDTETSSKEKEESPQDDELELTIESPKPSLQETLAGLQILFDNCEL